LWQTHWGGFAGPFLDPCAGGDEKHEAAYPTAFTRAGIVEAESDITTVDIRPDSRAVLNGVDYLTWKAPQKYGTIITNPPFVRAQEVIEKALTEVVEGGLVVMLLRLNFFGGQKRVAFWEAHPPVAAFVHSRRLSFTDNRMTDSIEYMHCVWTVPHGNKRDARIITLGA